MNAPLRDHREQTWLERDAKFGRWGMETVVVLLSGYFDESGEYKGKKLKRLTLGGFFAPWPEIEKLIVEWRKVLDDEGLSEFHMKNIASDEHDYANWPVERQTRLNRFVDILCEHAEEFAAFSYCPVSSSKRGFRDTYENALARVFIDAAMLCNRKGERGQIVFAQTQEISSEMVGAYFDRLGWTQYLDRWIVAQSRCEPALQAAEIVARGMKRLMQEGGITHSFAKVLMASRAPGKSIRFWPSDPFAALSAPWRYLGGEK